MLGECFRSFLPRSIHFYSTFFKENFRSLGRSIFSRRSLKNRFEIAIFGFFHREYFPVKILIENFFSCAEIRQPPRLGRRAVREPDRPGRRTVRGDGQQRREGDQTSTMPVRARKKRAQVLPEMLRESIATSVKLQGTIRDEVSPRFGLV